MAQKHLGPATRAGSGVAAAKPTAATFTDGLAMRTEITGLLSREIAQLEIQLEPLRAKRDSIKNRARKQERSLSLGNELFEINEKMKQLEIICKMRQSDANNRLSERAVEIIEMIFKNPQAGFEELVGPNKIDGATAAFTKRVLGRSYNRTVAYGIDTPIVSKLSGFSIFGVVVAEHITWSAFTPRKIGQKIEEIDKFMVARGYNESDLEKGEFDYDGMLAADEKYAKFKARVKEIEGELPTLRSELAIVQREYDSARAEAYAEWSRQAETRVEKEKRAMKPRIIITDLIGLVTAAGSSIPIALGNIRLGIGLLFSGAMVAVGHRILRKPKLETPPTELEIEARILGKLQLEIDPLEDERKLWIRDQARLLTPGTDK